MSTFLSPNVGLVSVIFSPEQMRASTFSSLTLLMLASLCQGQKKAALPLDYGMMQKKGALPLDYGMMQKKGLRPLDYGMMQKKGFAYMQKKGVDFGDLESDYGMQKKGVMGGLQKKGLFQKKGLLPMQKKGIDDDDVHVYITINQKKGIEFGQKKGVDMDYDMMQKKGIMDSMQKKGIFQKKGWQKKGLMPLQKKGMYPMQKKGLDYAMMQKKALGFGDREYGSDYME